MYQLVLQFAPWEDRPIDDLIELEEALESPDVLAETVDGHDIGSNEANIFVITAEPHEALRRALPYVQASNLRQILGAGIRDLNADDYVRCWPPNDASVFTVS